MPAIDDNCPHCGNGRYWVDRGRRHEAKRCTDCNHVVPDSAVYGTEEA